MIGKRQAVDDNDGGKTDKRPSERPSSYVVNEPRQAMVGDGRLSVALAWAPRHRTHPIHGLPRTKQETFSLGTRKRRF